MTGIGSVEEIYVTLPELTGADGLFVDGDWIETKDQDPAGDVRLIQLADIGIGEFLNRSRRFLQTERAQKLRCTFLKPGDVLIARMPDPLGRACIFPGDAKRCVTAVDVCILRADCSIVDSSWLIHMINSDTFARQLMRWISGTTRPRISRTNLARIRLALPALPEQRRIAAILDKADAIRRKRRESIKLLDELLKSVFLEMFGDPVTNPKGWEVKRLGEVLEDLRYGTSVKCTPEALPGTVPVLRIPNIADGEIDWTELKYTTLSEGEDRLLLQDGDILFVRTNGNPDYIARCAVFDSGDRSAAFASYLIRARLGSSKWLLPTFLQAAVSTPSFRSKLVRETRTTAGNYNISATGLRRLVVPVPPVGDQSRFTKIREALSNARGSMTKAFEPADDLFSSLSQRAFRGEL